MACSDDELWLRAGGGDAEAFGALFDRHARTIYNYCFRRVGDWGVAEDLVSVVFLHAWRRRAQPLPGGKVLPWLLGIATNVVRSRRRSLLRHRAALARLAPSGPEPAFAEDADSRVDDEREMRAALTLLRRLPRRDLEVLTLCGWFELSYEDAALALGVPVGTVRSRLSRARRRARELAAARGHEEDGRRPIVEPLRR